MTGKIMSTNLTNSAELAAAMPENGGKIVWVKQAFGPFWSYQMGN
jgi:amino acid transporter